MSSYYLAELVVAIRVEGGDDCSVQFEMHLIEAESAPNAYDKAMRIGHLKQRTYLRSDGALIEFQFRGLNELARIDESLQDGARILVRTQHDWTDEQIADCVTPREKLRAIQEEGIAGGGDTIQ
jgi:hypothetical protein